MVKAADDSAGSILNFVFGKGKGQAKEPACQKHAVFLGSVLGT